MPGRSLLLVSRRRTRARFFVCATCVWFCSVSICCVLCCGPQRFADRQASFVLWLGCVQQWGFDVLAAGCCPGAAALQLEARQRPVKSCASLFVGCRCLACAVLALICVPVFGTQRECAVPLTGVCVRWPTGGWGFEFCNKDIAKKRGLAEGLAGASHPDPACPGAACSFFCCAAALCSHPYRPAIWGWIGAPSFAADVSAPISIVQDCVGLRCACRPVKLGIASEASWLA